MLSSSTSSDSGQETSLLRKCISNVTVPLADPGPLETSSSYFPVKRDTPLTSQPVILDLNFRALVVWVAEDVSQVLQVEEGKGKEQSPPTRCASASGVA